MSTDETYEYGVAYLFGIDGAPVQAFVEPSDDWCDASQWLTASGDPDGRIVRRQVGTDTWEVAT